MRALSAYSNLSIRTLRTYLAYPAGPLPHYRVGGKILVKQSEFDEWVRRFRVEKTTQLDVIVADVLSGL